MDTTSEVHRLYGRVNGDLKKDVPYLLGIENSKKDFISSMPNSLSLNSV